MSVSKVVARRVFDLDGSRPVREYPTKHNYMVRTLTVRAKTTRTLTVPSWILREIP
jgi:hypothetical protein